MIRSDNIKRIPLWGLWDNRTPLDNPHKGWYLHYFDNCITKYFDPENPNDYLEDFPCFNHIYLRLAWSYLEPEEGVYNWDLIDDVIKRWWQHNRRCAFRISCRETDGDRPEQVYATPKWVIDAGCKGEMVGDCFEPDYGDPVFLEKFNNFMQAFGARYDGAPFLEYVDIGSMGEWGEGHTEGGSERAWPVEVMKEHVDIHMRAFKKTPVILNYDMVALRRTYDGTAEELQRYCIEAGCGVRADSGCVSFYEARYGLSSMHIPELFQPYWPNKPVDLELGHYSHVKKNGAWNNGYTMLSAIHEIHVTYGGFHGYAREWLNDNAHFAKVAGNLMGYWYFPQTLYMPEKVRAGQRVSMGMVWENRGVAPCYYKYNLYLKLTGEDGTKEIIHLREADNRRWVMNESREEIYSFRPSANLKPGKYAVSIGLFEPEEENPKLPEGYTAPERHPFPGRPIKLGIIRERLEEDGFYRFTEIDIQPYASIPYEGVVKVEPLWPTHPKAQK